jgi:hypothetical protein
MMAAINPTRPMRKDPLRDPLSESGLDEGSLNMNECIKLSFCSWEFVVVNRIEVELLGERRGAGK